MLTNSLNTAIIIIILIVFAGTVDFLLKEVYWQRLKSRGGTWSEMPKVFEHKYGWWIWITFLWALPLLYLSQYNKLFYAGFILFYLEDAVYFFWKKLIYKKIELENFNYLLPPFLRKYELTKRKLSIVIALQIILFCFVIFNFS